MYRLFMQLQKREDYVNHLGARDRSYQNQKNLARVILTILYIQIILNCGKV